MDCKQEFTVIQIERLLLRVKWKKKKKKKNNNNNKKNWTIRIRYIPETFKQDGA